MTRCEGLDMTINTLMVVLGWWCAASVATTALWAWMFARGARFEVPGSHA